MTPDVENAEVERDVGQPAASGGSAASGKSEAVPQRGETVS